MNRIHIIFTKSLPRFALFCALQRAVGISLAALVLAGCGGLGKPGSASFASREIHNHSPAEIEAAAVQVFRADGYAAYTSGPGQLRFEREGTHANDLAYNGVVGTHYGAKTLVRVKTQTVELGGGSYRLQCQAFMVRNAGDSFFEEETRLSNMRGGPYQQLLDEVAGRLK
jgi:hypothetical protein